MRRERQAGSELDRETVRAFAAAFISRFDRYPIQLPDGRYISVKKPLSMELVEAHLRGDTTLGAYALDRDSHARWVCFDADVDEPWKQLISLARNLATKAVPSYLERSRRGGHLWLFFSAPTPGVEARRFAQNLLAEHSISGVELFPKQDRLTTGPGSLVRLPLGVHRLTGRRYPFTTLGGEPLAPTIRKQVRVLANPQRAPRGFVEATLQRASLAAPVPSSSPPERPTAHPPGEAVSARIKAAISVYDFVSHYVELDGQGRGLCPFHDDHHKSFGVNAAGNYWHCFAGCGGGSLIDFWARWREQHGQDAAFSATLAELAEMLL